MKYGELNGLIEALKALRTQPQSFFTARKLKDVCDAVDKEAKWMSKQMQGIIAQCAEKDSEGKPVQTEDGNGIKIAKQDKFKKLVNELMDTETGDIPKVTEGMLKLFKVSVAELDSLLLICKEVKDDE